MWNNRQFWLDSLWRSARTFAQSMFGLLTAYMAWVIVPALQRPNPEIGQIVGGWKLWAAFVFASAVAALSSLFQSIDRERAVGAALPSVPAPQSAEPAAPATVAPASAAFVTPIGTPIDATTAPAISCGDALR